jgi:methylmalonyl-CoA mutase cobalamin-binding subunit
MYNNEDSKMLSSWSSVIRALIHEDKMIVVCSTQGYTKKAYKFIVETTKEEEIGWEMVACMERGGG